MNDEAVVHVTVSGLVGCGKSAIAGEIEIAMRALGIPVRWVNGASVVIEERIVKNA